MMPSTALAERTSRNVRREPRANEGRLAADELRALLRVADTEIKLTAGGVIAARETPSYYAIYILRSGFACRYRTSDFGREIHEFLLPGDVYVVGKTHPQSLDGLLAITQCRAAFVRDETMLALLENFPQIAPAMLRLSLAREANLRDAVCNIGRRPAARRVAYLLADLSARLADCGDGSQKNNTLPLSQGLLADATALSPVHVNRVLGDLKRRGLVESRRGKIAVPNAAALRAFAVSHSATDPNF